MLYISRPSSPAASLLRLPSSSASRFSPFSATSAACLRETTTTPSSSATTTSPGSTFTPAQTTGTLTAPSVAFTVPFAETARDQTGKPISFNDFTSRQPASMTSPTTPRALSAVASNSPNMPSLLLAGSRRRHRPCGIAPPQRESSNCRLAAPARSRPTRRSRRRPRSGAYKFPSGRCGRKLRARSSRQDWRARRKDWHRRDRCCGRPPASCEFLQSHGKEALVGLAICHRPPAIAATLGAAIERHPLVIGPQMLLRPEHLEGFVLRLPNLIDVED